MKIIDLDFLLTTEEYDLELDTMSLKANDHYAIDFYFYGAVFMALTKHSSF